MTKKEMLNTPEIKPTKQITNALKEKMQKRSWDKETVPKYRMALRATKIKGEQIFKVAVFTEPDYPAAAYIFLDVARNKYCTWDTIEKKWRTLMIGSMMSCSYYYGQESYSTGATRDMLKVALSTEGDTAFEIISKWQQGILDRDRERKKQKERDRIKKVMSYIRPLPKNFEDWANKQDDQLIFYNYSRKIKTGWCTYCRQEVPIKKPKHLKEGRCTKCGSKITYICNSRKSEVWTRGASLYLAQNYKDGIVSRRFWMSKKMSHGNVDIVLTELDRTIRTPGEYFEGYENDGGEWKAAKSRRYTSRYYGSYAQYLDHIQGGIQKLRSSYLLTDKSVELMTYLFHEQRHPVIEKCAKAGLTRLANQFITQYDAAYVLGDMPDGELAKCLGIDNMRLKRLKDFQKGGGPWDMLRWYQAEKEANTVWEDEMILHFALWKISPDDMDEMLCCMTLKKAYNYLIKQAQICNESTMQVLQTWTDYMSMAMKLKMDINKSMVYAPKNIDQAHKECIDLLNAGKIEEESKKLKKKWPKVEKNLKGLERYEWQDDKFCIVAPKSIADIYREGMLLKHCIHTCDIYWERITNKTTFLMFLRRADAPDTPWYTLEVEPGGNIRQKRTTGDNQNEDLKEALPFLKLWQQHIQKIMSEEDKKLAEESDRQRRENYKQIRKEEKKVWHGKLRGQLLADVLEADFMAAV